MPAGSVRRGQATSRRDGLQAQPCCKLEGFSRCHDIFRQLPVFSSDADDDGLINTTHPHNIETPSSHTTSTDSE